jgi:VWFA-related protein
MRRFALVCLALIISVTVAGQEPTPQQPAPQSPAEQQPAPVQGPTFKTGVEVIAVDVGVSDERGHPVTDLRVPDFVVKIDGVVRKVVSAEQVRIDVEAAKREAEKDRLGENYFSSNLTLPNGRMIVFAVDQWNIRPGAARPLLASAARFLDRLSPADRVAFVAYPAPGPAIDFTNDFHRVREAMRLVTGNQSRQKGKFNMGLWEAIAIAESHDEVTRRTVVARECSVLSGGDLERCEREIELEAAEIVMQQRQDTAASLRGLRDLLAQLTLIEGPKALVLLSEGLILEGLGGELDDIVRLAAMGRVSINVLLMDVPRVDVTQAELPPTATQDRDLQVRGLENLAGMSRGALYRIIGNGDSVFERLGSELSAYYVLGVEQAPTDRNGKRHRIDVEVRRRGVTLRSRRAFVLSSGASEKRTAQDNLVDALRSPFAVSELPLRLTNFAFQDPASSKVRVLIAAEIGQAGSKPAEYTVGYVLIDDQGHVAASGSDKRVLAPVDGRENAPLGYVGSVAVDPGVYSVRFGAVDATGRRGSVLRDVNAWKMSGEEFAVGDLMVGNAPTQGEPLFPQVEPRVHEGLLGAYVEVYATSPAIFEQTVVTMEIADDEDSPAFATVPARMLPGPQPTTRIAQAIVTARMLPPGRYLARAQIARGGKPAGVLMRPFMLVGGPKVATEEGGAVAVPSTLFSSIPRFDRTAVLKPDVIGLMLDQVQKSSPALKEAISAARAGRYGPAAVEALGAGDQPAAMFLRGLELFTKGELDQAAIQLQNAAGPRREYFPAAFYLGACFAAAGRDRDAAGVWQLAIAKGEHPTLAYLLFADARLRENQPAPVVEVLRPLFERAPQDDEIAKRLATAYVMLGKYVEAVPVFDGYLARHMDDQDALFSALMSHYEAGSRAGVPLSDFDRAKLTKYASAYKGPQTALVGKYLSALGVK